MNARIAAATDLHNRHASEIGDRVRTMEQLASDALVAVTQASDRGPELGQVAAGLDRLVAGFALDDAEDDLEHIDNRAARAVPIASS